MGAQYPELRERQDLILSVAEAEEVRFRQTIERGLTLLEDRFEALDKSAQKTLPGGDAFQDAHRVEAGLRTRRRSRRASVAHPPCGRT